MKNPRTYSIGITTTIDGLVAPIGVAMRRLLTIEAEDGLRGESEEAAVREFRVAWRKLQRRVRDIEDAAPTPEDAR